MRAIALIGAAPLPGQTIDCPGQILQIRDCPGDSGTVGAYGVGERACRLHMFIAMEQVLQLLYCVHDSRFENILLLRSCKFLTSITGCMYVDIP